MYNCFRCGKNGSWFDFKNAVIKMYYGKSVKEMVSEQQGEEGGGEVFEAKTALQCHMQMKKEIYPDINKYLTSMEQPE